MQLCEFDEVIERCSSFLKGLDASLLSGELAAEYAERFSRLERVGAAGKAICAKRVADTRHYQREGARDPASWLADLSGGSLSGARDALETASHLAELPRLDDSFRSGELSDRQAYEVSRAGSLDPLAEGELLETARRENLGGLKEKAARVAAAARSREEDEERRRRIHAGRHLRTFTSRDGAFEGRFSLTPEDGARLMGPLGALADLVFEQAWREGRHEPREAHLADALVALATGDGPGLGVRSAGECGGEPSGADDPSPGADEPPPGTVLPRPAARRSFRPDYTILVRVDFEALKRGHLLPGEECSIDGVGHVPVSVVQDYLDVAKVRLVVSDGVELKSIYSCRRNIGPVLDAALRARDRTCVVPGCGATFRLERDHMREYARSGPTSLDNLCLLCPHHHRLKSTKGYRIEGPPGRWKWLRPDGTTAEPFEGSGGAR